MHHTTTPELLAEIVAPPPDLQTSPPPARLAELETAIARAWEPYAAGKITLAVAERLAEPYMRELERLQQNFAPQLPAPTPAYDALAERFAQAITGALAFEDRRALLRLLDVRVYIGPEGPVRMTVCIP